ncbi:hypothetical protein [Lederbergia lenta]|uniref:hypothetical protein n=1 Tax=Lederbergia lenta TaxID=1467 RepID=UPI002041C364|nr:hypothetical protein [Lederbergia lenta]MCM3111693.1 hypothetical protein [Lederbergia lenta]
MFNPLFNPAAFLIGKGIETAIKSMQNVAKNGTVEELQTEAKKQEIQARVAQELAIAERISNAETVEIEEFYDVSGEGNLGVNAKKGSVNVGASGDGRKVTKRIYKFKGIIGQTEVNEVCEDDESSNEEHEVNFILNDEK